MDSTSLNGELDMDAKAEVILSFLARGDDRPVVCIFNEARTVGRERAEQWEAGKE